MKLGEQIKQIRKKKGLSQKQLAKQIGISANAMCSIENGKARASQETVESICKLLGVELKLIEKMRTQTFLIRCEYPDGDHIPTQEFVENIQEYFAANIMDGERGRLVVKPVYKPKRDPLYQECLDAVPEDIKERVGIEVEFSNFVSLVKQMREARHKYSALSREFCSKGMKPRQSQEWQDARKLTKLLESEVDEYLKKMDI